MSSSDLLLPAGTRLVHIGPHKTGTTAVQGAFHQNRDALHEQGVHYAGATQQPMWPVLSVLAAENAVRQVGAPRTTRPWRALVREVRRSSYERTVVSSEFFADAEDAAVRRVAHDLGAQAHVVVTLRPLSRILPSQWQQYVKSGMSTSYEKWLDAMLRRPDRTKLSPTFWLRHRHDALVRRWADVVGPDRVTVLVLDPAERNQVLRRFEQLLGLRADTLAYADQAENRSLTLPEVELIRQFNKGLKQQGLGKEVQHQAIRFGAAPFMQQRDPAPDEPRIVTPAWALEEAARIGAEMGEDIVASGVRVVGDVALLSAAPPPADELPPPPVVPPEVAARAALGIVHASSLPEAFYPDVERPEGVRPLPSRGVVRAGAQRIVGALRRRR